MTTKKAQDVGANGRPRPAILARFAARLREVRVARGLSQRQVHDRIGDPPVNLSRYEVGITMPQLHIASRIAAALRVTVDTLLQRPGEPIPAEGTPGKSRRRP